MKQLKMRMLASLLLCVALLLTACGTQTPDADSTVKTITVDVIANGDTATFTIETDAEMLRGALEEQNLIAGDESEYGLFVKTVNGITVNDANQEWWCFTKGGESLMTGVDSTRIADGDRFEITLTIGY